jgi:DNA-binding response OmpR family regulator
MKILLIEDDNVLIALLTRSLSSQHYIVDVVKDGEMGWTYASTFDYDSIVLDIMLPKLDGISLCKRLRGAGYTTPILLLTSQDNTTAKVQGLDAGADDYMVKPFELAELIARVRALRRRGGTNPLPLLIWGDLMLDPSTCEVTYNRQPLILTTKEYDLLELLLRDSYRVFSNEEIIDRLWSSDDFPAEATVRSHLRRLRQKLQAAGAPSDAIVTIHGRGYHLKSPQSNVNVNVNGNGTSDRKSQPSNPLVGAIHELPLPDGTDENDRLSDRERQQQQYLAFLQETWVTAKPQCLERLTEIRATVDRLLAGDCTYAEQQQAHQQAHKLVGTLGVLTLMSAMEIARDLEVILNQSTLLAPTAAVTLPTLLAELIRSIAQTVPSQTTHAVNPDLPLLLLIALNPTLTQSLSAIAESRGYRTFALSTIETAANYLATIADLHASPLILIGLADTQDLTIADAPLFDLIHNIDRQFPDRSVLILSDRDQSNDTPRSQLRQRLAVARHRGKFLNTTGLTADRIFTAAIAGLPAATAVKVMVVDDDLDWLRAIPKLLQPWGMKVTTLADPQQFWTVLQSVNPDALVLDIKMPEINGFELCQVLRSDPQWQHLPILFLTAAQDPIAQQQAFNVGADDYLWKPLMGGELAQRIRHRLARFQSLAL